MTCAAAVELLAAEDPGPLPEQGPGASAAPGGLRECC